MFIKFGLSSKSTEIFPPLILTISNALVQCREPNNWSAKGSNFKEDDSALALWELLLYDLYRDLDHGRHWVLDASCESLSLLTLSLFAYGTNTVRYRPGGNYY